METSIIISDDDMRKLNKAQGKMKLAQIEFELLLCELEEKYDFVIQRDNLILDKRCIEKKGGE